AVANEAMAAALHCRARASGQDGPAEPVASSGKVNLQKITVKAALEAAKEKPTQRVKELGTNKIKLLAKADGLAEKNPHQAQATVQVKADAEGMFERASKYIKDSHIANLSEIISDLERATTTSEVTELRQRMTSQQKLLNKDDVATFSNYCRTFNQTAGALGRQETAHNCAGSIFECKGGLRPALLTIADSNAFKPLEDAPIVKKGLKAVQTLLKTGTSSALQPPDGGKLIMKRLTTQIAAVVGKDLLSQRMPPRADWANNVFKREVIGAGSVDLNADWNAFGMMATYVVFSGNVVFCGFPTEKIDG
ncbi:unnamed protein product, partial [Prorocentrum cordatum]